MWEEQTCRPILHDQSSSRNFSVDSWLFTYDNLLNKYVHELYIKWRLCNWPLFRLFSCWLLIAYTLDASCCQDNDSLADQYYGPLIPNSLLFEVWPIPSSLFLFYFSLFHLFPFCWRKHIRLKRVRFLHREFRYKRQKEGNYLGKVGGMSSLCWPDSNNSRNYTTITW